MDTIIHLVNIEYGPGDTATYIIQASNRKAAENQTADKTELDII